MFQKSLETARSESILRNEVRSSPNVKQCGHYASPLHPQRDIKVSVTPFKDLKVVIFLNVHDCVCVWGGSCSR